MKVGKKEFSENEYEMIVHFKGLDIAEHCSIDQLFSYMVHKAFVDNDQSKHARNLRRCIVAFNQSLCYRNSPEWEKLFEE